MYMSCTCMLVVDHEPGRIWSHALLDKSIVTGHAWIQRRVARDVDNAGHKEVKVMILWAVAGVCKRLREAVPDPGEGWGRTTIRRRRRRARGSAPRVIRIMFNRPLAQYKFPYYFLFYAPMQCCKS